MIAIKKIRELDVKNSAGRSHLSAASGLVRAGSFLYVVADDELELGVFPANHSEPGCLIRLFEGELPPINPDRKRQKPDLEGLTKLPPSANFPNGALLALGSGSRRNRKSGAVLALDAHGAVQGLPHIFDLSPIYDPLEGAFPALNIEGAIVVGNELRLFQRGNKRNSANAIIRLPLSPFLDTVSGRRDGVVEPVAIYTVDLGSVGGVPFGFTDAAALPDGRLVFTAIAEDTDDTYDDGPCVAAAIGIVDVDAQVRRLVPLDLPLKVEGVDARVAGDAIALLLVTDADDPSIPAILYSATIGT